MRYLQTSRKSLSQRLRKSRRKYNRDAGGERCAWQRYQWSFVVGKFDGTASEGATVSSWTEKGDGSYVATLTTGGKTGELRVMPLFNGQPAATEAAQLTVIAGEMSSANSTLVADNKAPTVKTTTELTFTVKDAYGNPVTGMKPDAPVFSGAANTGVSVLQQETGQRR